MQIGKMGVNVAKDREDNRPYDNPVPRRGTGLLCIPARDTETPKDRGRRSRASTASSHPVGSPCGDGKSSGNAFISNRAAFPNQVVPRPLGRLIFFWENIGPAISFSEGGGKSGLPWEMSLTRIRCGRDRMFQRDPFTESPSPRASTQA